MRKGDFIKSDANGQAGQAIKRLRERLRLSQGGFGEWIAQRLNTEPVSQGTVSEWENNRANVPGAVLMAAGLVTEPTVALTAVDQTALEASRCYQYGVNRAIGVAA